MLTFIKNNRLILTKIVFYTLVFAIFLNMAALAAAQSPAPTVIPEQSDVCDRNDAGCEFGIGQIESPPGTDVYNQAAGVSEGETAIIFFISRLIGIATVIGGIWVVINVLLAAFFYITGSGDPGTHTKVRNLLTSSLVGLILIVSFYTLGGIIGLVFFGDASYILNPTI